jgi:hypothetical protein
MKKLILPLAFCVLPFAANALENDYGNWNFKLSGYGTAGYVSAEDKSDFTDDWQIRSQAAYRTSNDWLFGAAISHSAWYLDQDKPFMDAFAYTESPWGRAELGWTDTIAAKLGLGLPDVGGLRINNDPIIYEFANPEPMISRGTISGTQFAFRANAVSAPGPVQIGLSFAPKQHHFNSATDFGLKYKNSDGKTKFALSFGGSFIDQPTNFAGDIYALRANADWRGQISAGLNLQYNSWVWGLNTKTTYDKNPMGVVSDGVSVGTGISYDFLQWSASASYMLSQIGVFHDTEDYFTHTGIVSLRYKIDQSWNVWVSGGMVSATTTSPFISAGLMFKF